MPHGSEVDGIELAEPVHGALRKDLSRLQVPLAPEVESLERVLEAVLLRDGLEHLESLGNHFRSRAIPSEHRDLQHFSFVPPVPVPVPDSSARSRSRFSAILTPSSSSFWIPLPSSSFRPLPSSSSAGRRPPS